MDVRALLLDPVDVRGIPWRDTDDRTCWAPDLLHRFDEQGIQPAVCLYFSDMECSSYPEAKPGFPVLWVDWNPAPSQRNHEPWGERIHIASG